MKTSPAAKFAKSTALALAISIAPTWMLSNTAQAGISSQMNKVFGDMSNVTNPGAYKTQSRGVITGGRVTQKSKIFNEALVSFTAPSWNAGCGGVDLFGGSLSFINADQIVELMRAVAANAKGYFFQLALENTCPACSKHIEAFQRKIQSLNEHLGNSCQLAQGLVNDATNLAGLDFKSKTNASLASTASGLRDDFFGSREQPGGQSAAKANQNANNEEHKAQTGNIVWKQLRENNTKNWFGGNDELLEAILSLTGSVDIGEPVDDDRPTERGGDDATPINYIPGNLISLSDITFGGEVSIYNCSHDQEECKSDGGALGTKQVTIEGYAEKVDKMLQGSASTPGLLLKYRQHREHALSDDEKRFVENLPDGIGSIIRNLSALSPDAAKMFAIKSSNVLAIEMAFHTTDSLVSAAQIALSNSRSAYKSEAIRGLQEARQGLHKEYLSLSKQYGDSASLLAYYNTLIANVRKQQYTSRMFTKPPQMGTGN